MTKRMIMMSLLLALCATAVFGGQLMHHRPGPPPPGPHHNPVPPPPPPHHHPGPPPPPPPPPHHRPGLPPPPPPVVVIPTQPEYVLVEPQIIPGAQLSYDDALSIAMSRAGGGSLVESETKMRYHGMVYEFEIVNERGKFEIDVDGMTGNVSKFEQKPGSYVYQAAPAPYSYSAQGTQTSRQQAEAIAVQQAGGGYVYKYELDTENGRLIHEIEVYNNGRKYEIDIDDATGQMIKFKRD